MLLDHSELRLDTQSEDSNRERDPDLLLFEEHESRSFAVYLENGVLNGEAVLELTNSW